MGLSGPREAMIGDSKVFEDKWADERTVKSHIPSSAIVLKRQANQSGRRRFPFPVRSDAKHDASSGNSGRCRWQ